MTSRAMGKHDTAVIANLVDILHITKKRAHKLLTDFENDGAAK